MHVCICIVYVYMHAYMYVTIYIYIYIYISMSREWRVESSQQASMSAHELVYTCASP